MLDTTSLPVLDALNRAFKSFLHEADTLIRGMSGQDTLPANRAMSVFDVYGEVWETLCDGRDGMDTVSDIYLEGSDTFAVAVKEGKLYKVPLTVNGNEVTLGEAIEVVQQFTPAARSKFTSIERQADGRVRWTALASTATLNRDGMIDGTALFDSFEKEIDQGRELPYLTYWHEGEALRMGQADLVWRDGYCYFNTGLFDKDFPFTEEVAHALETDGDYWGVSIGFVPTSDPVLHDIGGIQIPVYTSGYQKELSILPEQRAASNLTSINVQRGKNMNATKRQDVLRLFSNDQTKAEQFTAGVEHAASETNAKIEQAGMVTREAAAQAAADATTTEQAKPTNDVETVIEITDELVNQLATAVTQSQWGVDIALRLQDVENGVKVARESSNQPVLDAIAQLRASVEDRLTKLERDDETKLREAVADQPSRSKVTLTYRPSQQRAASPLDLAARAEIELANIAAGGTLMGSTAVAPTGVRHDVV